MRPVKTSLLFAMLATSYAYTWHEWFNPNGLNECLSDSGNDNADVDIDCDNGTCCSVTTATGTGSTRITCAGDSQTSSWSGTFYGSSSSCGGSGQSISGDGLECISISGGAITVSCEDKGCFSGSSTVQLEDGSIKPYPELAIGDRVLSMTEDGQLVYDKVFQITHFEPASTAPMIRIETNDGHELMLTPDHNLHKGTCCSIDAAVPAAAVSIGDTVFVVDASSDLVPTEVKDVSIVNADGMYNAHTLSGNIVVNGMAATHFTAESLFPAGQRGWATHWNNMLDSFYSVTGAKDASKESPSFRPVEPTSKATKGKRLLKHELGEKKVDFGTRQRK